MNRNEIIKEVGKFFKIEELACPHTLAEWGERSWQFINTDLMHCLLIIRRDILQVPMIINTETQTQRGLRCNLCDLVKAKTKAGKLYLTAHKFGMAVDCTVIGLTAEEARQRIKQNAHLLPCPIRMEKDVKWLHIDVLQQYGVTDKVYEFTE